MPLNGPLTRWHRLPSTAPNNHRDEFETALLRGAGLVRLFCRPVLRTVVFTSKVGRPSAVRVKSAAKAARFGRGAVWRGGQYLAATSVIKEVYNNELFIGTGSVLVNR